MKKSRPISRLTKAVYLFMVAVILFSMATMAVSAAENANSGDTRVTKSGYLTNGVQTPFRTKEDATSCYIYNSGSDRTLSVMAYGNTSTVWSSATNMSALSYGKAVPVGAEREIPNYVYEELRIWHDYGEAYAALWAWTPDSNIYETVDFWWSPDCVGNYP